MTIFVHVQDSNEPPKFDADNSNITTNVKSDSRQSLFKVHATDPDGGNNGALYYRIRSDPASQFKINEENGEVSIKEGVRTQPLY